MDALPSLFPQWSAPDVDGMHLIRGCRADGLGGGPGARCTYADRPPAVAEYLDALVGAARGHPPAETELILEPGRSGAGAYCFAMSNHYRGNRRIPVVIVADGVALLAVCRETWGDLLARDVD